ncbi:MAG TPA: mycofactocin biosynthesis glycosyltransferase MftF [Solirubrobacteraceae bacterium]|nr:mycofactocin biosynthesis glycosyltransferase MftF [Solirubrobacteraceae bacterium]
MRLALDPSTRLVARGAVVLGGRPARMLRLTPAGAKLVTAWRDGGAVGDQPAARRLAARLIDTGLAHPLPAGGEWTTADVAVVIPARDRADLLAECLARLGPAAEVVVVDDGSRDPAAIAAAARKGGARVVRAAVRGGPAGTGGPVGPAGARNAGIAATTALLVAFLDSDTRPDPGWLQPLLGHFEDTRTAAVAPRIAVPAGRGALAAYEAVRSPLDLGAAPGVVGPDRRIGFVPAAALVVRREALTQSGGFDGALRVGEDVDLVWRLAAAGWTVRYEPTARVEHPHRAAAGAWLGQRVAYGASAGALARRHPGRLPHVIMPTWALAPWLLAAAGRPRLAGLAAIASTGVLAARLPAVPEAPAQMLAVAAAAQLRVGQQLLDAAWRAYPPFVFAAARRSRRARGVAAGALAVSIAADWGQRRPRLDPVRFGALRTADDLAYATGVWLGCLRARTAGPLVPALVRGPRR